MKLKKMINRINNYIFDSSVSLKDRSFVVFSFILIAELVVGAIPTGIVMNELDVLERNKRAS